MRKYRSLYKTILILFVLAQFQFFPFIWKRPFLLPGTAIKINPGLFSFIKPLVVDTANFSSASATLSNSRLSYRAGVASGSSGSSTVTIDTSADGNNGDLNTNHLFPKDTVCFTDAGLNGCIGNTNYTVANIVDTSTFNTSTVLGDNLDTSGFAVATQSATHTITFTLVTAVPSNGDIYITIPAVNVTGKTNDGLPDSTSSVATNGFDLNGLDTSNITVTSSGCDNNWTVANVTAGTASTDHTIRIDRSTNECAASSTITITIGDGTKKLINPAPYSSESRTQGLADIYTINVKTRDGSDNTIDESDIKIAPVEGVLVSATVDETLSFQVTGKATSTSACGQTTDVTTTAYSVPWGTIATADTFLEGAQQLTVSTNADGGYSVTIEENDQMGKDGITCTGAGAGEANNCIQDTTCNATGCTETTSQDWTDAATYHGLGYSLANVDGTDATFLYNDLGRSFSAKQIADLEASEIKQQIMRNTGPVNSKDIYVCFRIAISSTQPAGYYYNKIKYIATASF